MLLGKNIELGAGIWRPCGARLDAPFAQNLHDFFVAQRCAAFFILDQIE